MHSRRREGRSGRLALRDGWPRARKQTGSATWLTTVCASTRSYCSIIGRRRLGRPLGNIQCSSVRDFAVMSFAASISLAERLRSLTTAPTKPGREAIARHDRAGAATELKNAPREGQSNFGEIVFADRPQIFGIWARSSSRLTSMACLSGSMSSTNCHRSGMATP